MRAPHTSRRPVGKFIGVLTKTLVDVCGRSPFDSRFVRLVLFPVWEKKCREHLITLIESGLYGFREGVDTQYLIVMSDRNNLWAGTYPNDPIAIFLMIEENFID